MSKHHDAPARPRERTHVRAREEAAQKAMEAAEAAQQALEAAEAAREALEEAVRAEQEPLEGMHSEEVATVEGTHDDTAMKPQEVSHTEKTAARASALDTKQTGLPVGESNADWSRQSKPAARFLRRICSASKWTGVNSEEFTRYLMREAEKVDRLE